MKKLTSVLFIAFLFFVGCGDDSESNQSTLNSNQSTSAFTSPLGAELKPCTLHSECDSGDCFQGLCKVSPKSK